MRISLGVVWLKCVFLVCTDPVRTPYGLTTKNETKMFLYIYDMLQKTFVESLFQFPWACLAVLLRIVFRPKNVFKYFYDKKKTFVSKAFFKVQKNTWSLFCF